MSSDRDNIDLAVQHIWQAGPALHAMGDMLEEIDWSEWEVCYEPGCGHRKFRHAQNFRGTGLQPCGKDGCCCTHFLPRETAEALTPPLHAVEDEERAQVVSLEERRRSA